MAVGLAGATGAVTARNRKGACRTTLGSPARATAGRLALSTELHSGRSLHHKTITPSYRLLAGYGDLVKRHSALELNGGGLRRAHSNGCRCTAAANVRG